MSVDLGDTLRVWTICRIGTDDMSVTHSPVPVTSLVFAYERAARDVYEQYKDRPNYVLRPADLTVLKEDER